MRRAFFLCSRTFRLSSSVKSNRNPLLNNKFDYIPKFPLVAFPSSNFSFSSSGNDSTIEKPDASNVNEPALRPEARLDDTVNSKETAIMDAEDIDNKVLKSKLEDYLHKQKEDVLPEIFEDILRRRLAGKHNQTDDELIDEMNLQPLNDVKDAEFESDFEDLYKTDNEIDDLYEAGDLVQKRMASNEFFNMDDKKWDGMIKEATEKGYLADMRECEEVLEDMLSWDKLLPDEIKKKVEAKFDEITDRVEKGELEVKEGYDLFKEFEDEMVKECMDLMDAKVPLQFDVPDKKKDLDDPPGQGLILRWQTRVVLAPGGDAWHLKNRKVRMSVTVKELGLSKHQFRRFRELAGKRYHPGRDELTIVSERFEHREENRKDCLRTLFNLIEEAGKANKMVEDALNSHLKDGLKSNPHFMARLNAFKMGILASNACNFPPRLSSSSIKSSARPFSSNTSDSISEHFEAKDKAPGAGKISNAELKQQIEKMYNGDEDAFMTVFESILQRKLEGNTDELDADLLNNLPNTSRAYISDEDNNQSDSD